MPSLKVLIEMARCKALLTKEHRAERELSGGLRMGLEIKDKVEMWVLTRSDGDVEKIAQDIETFKRNAFPAGAEVQVEHESTRVKVVYHRPDKH